ncbi:hypothetical protein U1Q18_029070 [Sarracenia purpurea var. burkii]
MDSEDDDDDHRQRCRDDKWEAVKNEKSANSSITDSSNSLKISGVDPKGNDITFSGLDLLDIDLDNIELDEKE